MPLYCNSNPIYLELMQNWGSKKSESCFKCVTIFQIFISTIHRNCVDINCVLFEFFIIFRYISIVIFHYFSFQRVERLS